MIKEPAYDHLRTQQQLGYIVWASFTNYKNVVGGKIVIQSSEYNPDYLESRINAFLKTTRDKGKFEKEKFESVKEATIKTLKQVDMNYLEEASDHWSQILEGQLAFDKYQRYIEEIEQLTPEMVFAKFEDLFFKNPKRLNVKLWSQNHKVDNKE